MGVFVGNFGIIDGVQTYRVNGSKDDLQKIINEVKEEGVNFKQEPIMEYVRKGEWSVLLEIVLAPTPTTETKEIKEKDGIISKKPSYNKI